MANESFATFIEWAVEKCENERVGYSKQFREGEWTTAYPADTAYTNGQSIQYYDCSSFVYYALGAAGFSITQGAAFDTSDSSEGSWLLNHGWKAIDPSKDGGYQQGDIGKTSGQGHTEICYEGGTSSGLFMGAHGRELTDDYGNSIGTAPLPVQVSIGRYASKTGEYQPTATRTFAKVYRYYDWDGSTPQPTPTYNQFSFFVAAAMAGNMWQESNINPSAWESLVVREWDGLWYDNTGGYGLGQWTNTNGNTHGRLWQLYNYLTDSGYGLNSGDGQVTYFRIENYWRPSGSSEHEYYGNLFPTLDDFLFSDSEDLETLTHAWNRCWEDIHDSSWDLRVTYTQECYDYIVEHWDDENIDSWYKGNRYLSESEILNNAVMLFRSLNNHYGSGDITDPDGSTGDSGGNGNKDDTGLSFNDFLYSMLSKDSDSNTLPVHIIKKRR